ncbi:hypothetical protein SO802_006229 [Lithocarpus litseifolius]|uniref:Reverse transcriptase n=1 Tax=Lithocarpus litseifolius TaxID=425828 RepID=A0AAW2DQW4_9ROSI
MFLAKTWAEEARLRRLCVDLKFDHCWIGPSAGKTGCLVLLWKDSVSVEVVSSSPNHIDALVGADPVDQFSLPWLCVDDFNELLWSHEKLGLGPKQDCRMKEFRDVLDECGFMDLGYVGEKFTWRGKRAGGMVLERLDRADATNGWFSRFPGFKVQHLHTQSSDHKAILIKLEGISPRPNRPFKFEQMWLKEGACSEIVIKAWGSTSLNANMPQIVGKILACGEKLTTWSQQSFGSIKRQVVKKSKLLSKAELDAANGKLDYEMVKARRAEVNDLLDKESQMWQQRSRSLFLKCGDRNTSYFHSKASHRFRRNRISGLRDSSNSWCTDDRTIRNIACDYYQSLFTSGQPLDFSVILEAVKPTVTESMNSQILRPFLKEEVEVAIKQMKPISAPSPDANPLQPSTPQGVCARVTLLSPYLFLICSEGLHSLLHQAAEANQIWGVSICRSGPRLTHLFFADDCLVFCQAFLGECRRIQELLDCYEKALGPQLNHNKTGLFFSKSTPPLISKQIKDALGVQEMKQYEKYLGLPTLVGRNKKASLRYIKERIESKLQGWKELLLSQAGREILLKAVIQAISTLAMSCFKLLATLCNDIEVLIRKFWWGQRGNQRKIHWTKWSSLCHPKQMGGMGFKELQKFNDAMIAKQVWRLMDNKSSLFHRFFKAKFFPNGSILDAKEGNGSFAWKSILKGREVIKNGVQWRVGNGSLIRIYHYSWLPNPHNKCVVSPRDFLGCDARVSVLIDSVHHCSMKDTIDNIFLPHEAAMIISIPLSFRNCVDKYFWPYTTDGSYSAKSRYKRLLEKELRDVPSSSDSTSTSSIWKGVWRLQVPNRVKTVLWRASLDSLPSKANLRKRKIASDVLCPGCKLTCETTLHALWSCTALSPVWDANFAWLLKKTKNCLSLLDVIQCCQDHSDSLDLFAMIISLLWTRRNKLRVGESVPPLANINALAADSLQEFHRAQSSPIPTAKPVIHTRWSPPPAGWVKVNFDEATFKESNLAGLGGVIRNDRGLIMAAFTQTIPLPTSVEMVEVLAARNALGLVQELCLNKVQLEGDSEVIINALSTGVMVSSSYGHIIMDINHLSSAFQCLAFCHTRRPRNKVAHKLARSACMFSPFQVWLEEIPLEVVSVYSADIP